LRLTLRSTLAAVAVVAGDVLRRAGIHAVLTGGACAHLYAGHACLSVDADFIVQGPVTREALDAAMTRIGFARRGDRYVHERARFYVEFPRGPLAIGNDYRIRPVTRSSRYGRTLALSATDSCRDRLAAFYHWRDRQSLAVAVRIAARNRVSFSTIRAWSADEGFLDEFGEFEKEARRTRARRSAARRLR
jgi:hypothetical protein